MKPFQSKGTPMKDAVREAREAILAVIGELKLAGAPVPIGLHRAAQALYDVLEDEPCRSSVSNDAEQSTRH
jgi:hypothetical protein